MRTPDHYEPPSDKRFARSAARRMFLEEIVKLELADQQTAEPPARRCQVISDLRSLYQYLNAPTTVLRDKAIATRVLLSRWARNWNLNAGWLIEHALLQFELWDAPAEKAEDDYATWPVLGDSISWRMDVLPSSPPGWPHRHPFESRSEYLALIERQTRAALETQPLLRVVEASHREAYIKLIIEEAARYCDRIDQSAEEHLGWRPVWQAKFTRRDARWCVLYQIARAEWGDIAADHNASVRKTVGERVSSDAVRKQVESFLDLLGIQKRSSKKGRPKSGNQ